MIDLRGGFAQGGRVSATERDATAAMTAPTPRLTRRAALLLPLLLAACGGDQAAAPNYQPPSYDYLTKLRLAVGSISIDDSWVPRGAARHVEYLAPTPPLDALRRMAQDRLVATGGKGRASFVIDDASIIRSPRQYEGSLAVRLDVADDSGTSLGHAGARVTRTRDVTGEDPEQVRADLYALVRDMMRDMNVEFEYQVRRAMKNMLEATNPEVPPAGPVQSEDLGAPGAGVSSGAPGAPAAPDKTP